MRMGVYTMHGEKNLLVREKVPWRFEVFSRTSLPYHINKGKENLVCKLKKSLYGLKQAPRECYHKFNSFLLSQGYKRSDIDHYLYTKQAKNCTLLILILYVDDIILARKNIKELAT